MTESVNRLKVGDERRQQILQAALEVFMRHGYRRTTMDDLARAVGLSRPTLYLSFPGKEAIFRAVVAAGQDDMNARIERGLPTLSTLEDKLRHVFEIWSVEPFEQVARSPAAEELISSSYAFARDVFEAGADRLRAVLTRLMVEAVDDAQALRPSAEARARVMLAAAHGFKSVARDTADMRALVGDLVRMVVEGLGVERAPASEPAAISGRRTKRRR